MSASAPLAAGGFQPRSGFGFDRPYQDGIFIRSQFHEDLKIEARENDLKVVSMFGERLGASKSKPGERHLIPTQSNLAVGDVVDTITTSGFSFPDYIATDAPTITNLSDFSRKIGSGASFLGIPLPLQAPNEGQVELMINQYRGTALVFTKRFIEQCLGYVKNPSKAYASKIRYALNNDMDEYCWLTWLYTGPITPVVDDYGTGLNSFTDAIGLTNRANYQLTRTLTAINVGTNLITPTATGNVTAAGLSNTGNARFSSSNVPWLFGSTGTDISFDTLARLEENFNRRNVPFEGRGILCEPKGYNDIKFLPQYSEMRYGQDGTPQKTGRVKGKVLEFSIDFTNVIQPANAASNVLYEIAGTKGTLLYEIDREAEVIIDDKLSKPEMAICVVAATRYGAVIQRPDHAAVIQTRTRV